jgi:Holliday junction resolvasome RuvABC endonuclease subunit
MRVLSIDQSLRQSGITIYTNGMLDKALIIGAPKDIKDPTAQLIDVAYKLTALFLSIKPDVILMEGLPYGSASTSVRALAALFFRIQEIATHLGIEYKVYPPTQVKKTAGSGKASKQDMIDALPEDVITFFKDTCGVKKTTGLSDLADSYFIWLTYQNEHKE